MTAMQVIYSFTHSSLHQQWCYSTLYQLPVIVVHMQALELTVVHMQVLELTVIHVQALELTIFHM